MNLIEELKWRGLYQDSTEDVEQYIGGKHPRAYIGYDPTADSLHIGNLATIMLLVHFQKYGGQPYVLMGGATGRIGDPSGKKSERVMLSEEVIENNLKAQKAQFKKFLDFEGDRAAVMVNNYDWYKEMNILSFLRDVGKHLTVNYMMAKDSVKSRMETGISFTEFSYQLLQGYDFYYLNQNQRVGLQMGGSDQWGNITTGTELIRRMTDGEGEGHALTCPLVTKADGSKFGKSEGGNVWLDPEKTSPYKFYQYFLNSSDEEAEQYLKIFSLKPIDEIKEIIEEHKNNLGARIAQKALAEELTIRVHSQEEYDLAIKASQILFGKSTKEDFEQLSERQFKEIFDAVPEDEFPITEIETGVPIYEFVSSNVSFLASSSEARRAIKEGSLRVNKEQVNAEKIITAEDLIHNKYILLQRGKKKYFLAKAL